MFSRRRSYLRAALLASTGSVYTSSFFAGDPYREYVVLDQRQTGADGGVNNNFTDSSSGAHTITANGDVTQGSFSPFQPTGWANYFGGSDYLSFPDHADLDALTGDFTIQFWIKPSDNLAYGVIDLDMNGTGVGVYHHGNLGGQMIILLGATEPATMTFQDDKIGKWNHVLFSRSGSTMKSFLNGVEQTSGSNSTSIAPNRACNIGGYYFGGSVGTKFTGQLSDLRYDVGIAVTADFTPPTEALTAITETELLTCQDSRFLDNSTVGHVISADGDPAVVPGSPYGQTVAYDPAIHGGSLYLDGTGDYLTVSDHADFDIGASEFSLRGWAYHTARAAAYDFLVGQWDNSSDSYIVFVDGTSIYLMMNGGVIKQETWQPDLNSWYYWEVCRDSSDDIRIFINGVELGSATSSSTTAINSTAVFSIGARGDAISTTLFIGYMSDVEAIVGSGGNTTSYTPPSSPTLISANTKLLLSCQDAAIYDASCNSNIRLIGDAQLDTSQTKIDDGSALGDGSGDYVQARPPNTDYLTIGTRDFTIEFWIRLGSTSGTPLFFDVRNGTSTVVAPVVYSFGGNLTLWVNGTNVITGAALSTGVWYHVAVCKHDGTTRMFLDGVQTGSDYSDSNDYIAASQGFNFLGTDGLNYATANIEGIRITLDVARYIGTFEVPTAEHPEIHGYAVDAEETSDTYFDKVQLLLKTLSSDGLDNDTFTDSSATGHTVTPAGAVTQGSFGPYQPHGWGVEFDGASQLATGAHSDWDFGTGDFTAECWFEPASVSGNRVMLANGGGGTENWLVWHAGNQIRFTTYVSSTPTTRITATTIAAIGERMHIAVSREGNDFKLWINGIQEGSTWTDSGAQGTSSNFGVVGSQNSVNYFSGKIWDARFVKGTAVYTAGFTPPTTPLTAISGTVLLACNANRFIDSSSSAHTLTRTGTPVLVLGGPVTSTTAYVPATHGGSASFTASGDKLEMANSSEFYASTACTFEAWIYPTAFNTYNTIVSKESSGSQLAYWFRMHSGTLNLYFSTDGVNWPTPLSGGTPILNTWNHVAFVWDGTNIAIMLNGARTATQVQGGFANVASTVKIGVNHTTPLTFEGYITEARFTQAEVYDAGLTTYTVPTAQLTAITNTRFLLLMDGAGIYDATCKDNLALLGDAQTDTAEFKFGPSSMKFDGSNDQLLVPMDGRYVIGDADYCLEMWMFIDAHKNWNTPVDFRSANTSQPNIYLWADSSGVLNFRINGIDEMQTTVQAATWFHFALTRKGGAGRMFINGAMVDSWSDTVTYTSPADISFGGKFDAGNPFDGKLEDIRLTIGEARYTADFAIPTSDLPAIGP